MKPNELKCTDLRVGNYVNIEGDVVKVKEIYEKSIHYANGEYESYATEDFIHPIKLTEDVLVKLGFKKNIIYGSVIEYFPIDDNLARIFCTKEKQNFKIQIVRKNITETIVKYIKYLHQLQNAYFLLTNQEMKIEL